MVDVCLLGNGGMKPTPDRWLTSMLLRYNGRMLLTDCGEGTQIQISKCGWGFKDIDAICLTHFHADHIAGLPGLLLTIGNSDRKEDIYLYGPPGLERLIENLSVIFPDLPYKLVCVELPLDRVECVNVSGVVIRSMPVLHRIPCLAYSFEIPRNRKFIPDKARKLGIPVELWKRLQEGEMAKFGDKIFLPEQVLGEHRPGIKVSYCTDSRPLEGLIEFVLDSDLFICEGIYDDIEKQDKAIMYGHMISHEAARIAKVGNVKELWITHLSPSIKEPESRLEEVRRIFQNTHVGHELKKTTLHFRET